MSLPSLTERKHNLEQLLHESNQIAITKAYAMVCDAVWNQKMSDLTLGINSKYYFQLPIGTFPNYLAYESFKQLIQSTEGYLVSGNYQLSHVKLTTPSTETIENGTNQICDFSNKSQLPAQDLAYFLCLENTHKQLQLQTEIDIIFYDTLWNQLVMAINDPNNHSNSIPILCNYQKQTLPNGFNEFKAKIERNQGYTVKHTFKFNWSENINEHTIIVNLNI